MDLDEVFSRLCEFGAHQKRVLYAVALLQVFMACQIVHNVYMGAEPNFVCIQGGKEVEKCGEKGTHCDSYRFIGDDFTSVVSEVSSL